MSDHKDAWNKNSSLYCKVKPYKIAKIPQQPHNPLWTSTSVAEPLFFPLSLIINHPTIPQIRFVTLRGVPER